MQDIFRKDAIMKSSALEHDPATMDISSSKEVLLYYLTDITGKLSVLAKKGVIYQRDREIPLTSLSSW